MDDVGVPKFRNASAAKLFSESVRDSEHWLSSAQSLQMAVVEGRSFAEEEQQIAAAEAIPHCLRRILLVKNLWTEIMSERLNAVAADSVDTEICRCLDRDERYIEARRDLQQSRKLAAIDSFLPGNSSTRTDTVRRVPDAMFASKEKEKSFSESRKISGLENGPSSDRIVSTPSTSEDDDDNSKPVWLRQREKRLKKLKKERAAFAKKRRQEYQTRMKKRRKGEVSSEAEDDSNADSEQEDGESAPKRSLDHIYGRRITKKKESVPSFIAGSAEWKKRGMRLGANPRSTVPSPSVSKIPQTAPEEVAKDVSEATSLAKRYSVGDHTGQRFNPARSLKKTVFNSSIGKKTFESPTIESAEKRRAEEEALDIVPEELKKFDPKLVERVQNEVLIRSIDLDWDEIAGLEDAKQAVKEMLVWPLQRPDLFQGIRGPPRGLLLFGPPRNGENDDWESDCEPHWVYVPKYFGQLFDIKRSESDFEASRRIKTEFLVQLDGAGTSETDKVFVIGATNRPYDLDEAARRRLVKRLYIPLPDREARRSLLRNLLKTQDVEISEEEWERCLDLSNGYSGADIRALCTEASYGPIRDTGGDILLLKSSQVRAISLEDFEQAFRAVRPSVSTDDLTRYCEWNRKFGSFFN